MTWGWQQNRAVVGHNLKIAWNLMRIQQRAPAATSTSRWRKQDRRRSCRRSAATGSAAAGTTWWSASRGHGQEVAPLHLARPQGLVAAGAGDPRLPDPRPASLGDDEYLRLGPRGGRVLQRLLPRPRRRARVYFNVLANGMPYLLGTERLKGSHSMAGYHSFELCYLADGLHATC